MQGEFYTAGKYHEPGCRRSTWRRASTRSRRTSCSTAPKARSSATRRSRRRPATRCGSSSATPARTSIANFHVIGEIFDSVYPEGGIDRAGERADDARSRRAARRSSRCASNVPGTYALVDHALFRAFNKGAVGQLRVDGPSRADLMTREAERHRVRGRRRGRAGGEDERRSDARARRDYVHAHLRRVPSGVWPGTARPVPAAREVRLPRERAEGQDHRPRPARLAGPGDGQRHDLQRRDAADGIPLR